MSKSVYRYSMDSAAKAQAVILQVLQKVCPLNINDFQPTLYKEYSLDNIISSEYML